MLPPVSAEEEAARPLVLVTGGAGFIGSHTVIELLDAGYNVVVVDSLFNAKVESLVRVQSIAQRRLRFFELDLCNLAALRALAAQLPAIHAVIHFAGLKAVGESVRMPLEYYENNVGGTFNLLRVMREHSVRNLIFSSSATVYGEPDRVPIDETAATRPTNPYGRTKLHIEDILRDVSAAGELRSVLLRYFNPIGAHPSGRIGEDPNGTPNNLMPIVARTAVGRLPHVSVFGDDWPTPDGTGVRDYVHVVDLARGHVASLRFLEAAASPSVCEVFNLGTGVGYSVLQLIHSMRAASGAAIPYQVVARRPGDTASVYADPSRARTMLGWSAQLSLEDMCRDTWRWQSTNPSGFS
jgi:UDP-glucose 4-epimerase